MGSTIECDQKLARRKTIVDFVDRTAFSISVGVEFRLEGFGILVKEIDRSCLGLDSGSSHRMAGRMAAAVDMVVAVKDMGLVGGLQVISLLALPVTQRDKTDHVAVAVHTVVFEHIVAADDMVAVGYTVGAAVDTAAVFVHTVAVSAHNTVVAAGHIAAAIALLYSFYHPSATPQSLLSDFSRRPSCMDENQNLF